MEKFMMAALIGLLLMGNSGNYYTEKPLAGPVFEKAAVAVDGGDSAPVYPWPAEAEEADPFLQALGEIDLPVNPWGKQRIMRHVPLRKGRLQESCIVSPSSAQIFSNDGEMWQAKKGDSFLLRFNFVYNDLIQEESAYAQGAYSVDPAQRLEIGYICDGLYTTLEEGEITEDNTPWKKEAQCIAPADGNYIFVLLNHSKYDLGMSLMKVQAKEHGKAFSVGIVW